MEKVKASQKIVLTVEEVISDACQKGWTIDLRSLHNPDNPNPFSGGDEDAAAEVILEDHEREHSTITTE